MKSGRFFRVLRDIKSLFNFCLTPLRGPHRTNLKCRYMEEQDVQFVLGCMVTAAKDGHFTAALLDEFECEKFRFALTCRANNEIRPKEVNDKPVILTNFYFIFENETGEKVGFIELSEKQPGDLCRTSLQFNDIEILSLFVVSEHRGNGYAKYFIEYALSEFTINGTIFSRCLKPSWKMVGILESLGFNTINITPRGTKWMERR